MACAAVAAFLPGDAITLVLETVPLYLLYEASILVAVARRAQSAAARGQQASGAGGIRGEPAPSATRRPSGAKRAADNRPRGPGPTRLMLFDLQRRDRRRAVRVIYIGLAAADRRRPGAASASAAGSAAAACSNAASENEGSGGASFAEPDQEIPKSTPSSSRATSRPGKN